jgi:predicted dienelactone hydrolase
MARALRGTVVVALVITGCTTLHAGYAWKPFIRDPSGPVRSFHVWYPTDWPEKPYTYSPTITGMVLVDAPLVGWDPLEDNPATKKFPVVILSHVEAQAAPSLSYIAERLARRGIVAAAIDHSIDAEREGADVKTILRARLVDLIKLRDFLSASGDKWAIDLDRLGIAGISEGGLTALLALGAHLEVDPLLVGKDPEQRRLAESMKGFAWSEMRLFPVRAAAVIAPLGAGMALPRGSPLSILFLAGREDRVTPIATNLAPFVERFQNAGWSVETEEIARAKHMSFLSSCATPQPQCEDTNGMEAVREETAGTVASFFARSLAP